MRFSAKIWATEGAVAIYIYIYISLSLSLSLLSLFVPGSCCSIPLKVYLSLLLSSSTFPCCCSSETGSSHNLLQCSHSVSIVSLRSVNKRKGERSCSTDSEDQSKKKKQQYLMRSGQPENHRARGNKTDRILHKHQEQQQQHSKNTHVFSLVLHDAWSLSFDVRSICLPYGIPKALQDANFVHAVSAATSHL